MHYFISRDSNESAVDYSSRDYWECRFNSEESFEWLQPLANMVPFVLAEFEKRAAQDDSDIRLLHIGCGSSRLSNELRRLTATLDIDARTKILNVDFSEGAIERGQQHEISEFGDTKMRWAVLDLLNWKGITDICTHDMRYFDVIVEKSCSDAIACGEDVEVTSPSYDDFDFPQIPESRSCLSHQCLAARTSTVSPEIALAVHLSRITRPGATWIALSYSSSRFDYLKTSVRFPSRDTLSLLPWTIVQVHTLPIVDDRPGEASGATQDTVHRPQIFHYVYVLRRSDVGDGL